VYGLALLLMMFECSGGMNEITKQQKKRKGKKEKKKNPDKSNQPLCSGNFLATNQSSRSFFPLFLPFF